MDVAKIKDGNTYRYKSRKHEGRGKCVETYRRKTGDWVILHDAKRNVSVTVRPSQVSSR